MSDDARLTRILLAIAFFTPGVALAATCTLNVSGAVSFGVYDGTQANDTGATTISGTCSRGAGFDLDLILPTITLSAGNSGTYTPWRRMTRAAAGLSYNLYLDAARTLVWGDGTAGTLPVVPLPLQGNGKYLNPNSSVNFSYTVYGRIPAASATINNTVVPGTYTDNIIVTINY